MFNLGPMELVIILLIVLIFFGSSRLPGLAKSLGQSVKSFKKGLDDTDPASGSQGAPERIEKHNDSEQIVSGTKEKDRVDS